ncbi:YhgE/Pip family protein [Paenibacillus marinisediminis]
MGTNWAAAIIIVGLAILPSLYAWFNIASSWDPYGQTSGLPIAVANLDAGTTLQGTALNIGDEIVNSLKDNHNLGWHFTDKDSAIQGVKRGDDYAAIIIPEDFSARIGSVLTDEPAKAEIHYYINEKINAIAPKVTVSGASGIVQSVSQNIVQTASDTIFRILNELGIELKNNLPVINKVERLVYSIESQFPELNAAMQTAIQDMKTANEIVSQAQKSLPLFEDIATKGQETAGALADFAKRTSEAAVSLDPLIKQDLAILNEAAIFIQQVLDQVEQSSLAPAEAAAGLKKAVDRAGTAAKTADLLADLFGRLNQVLPGTVKFADDLKRLSDRFTALQNGLEDAAATISPDGTLGPEQLAKLRQLADDVAKLSGEVLTRYDKEIGPRISEAINRGQQAAPIVQTEMGRVLEGLPEVQRILQDAEKGLAAGKAKATEIQNHLPEAEQQVKAIADRFRKLDQSGEIQEIIDFLNNNFEQESNFFAEPVVLKENRLYPIPNYGSAMSPFFTTLSLWVGALLLVSLLSVEVHEEKDPPYRNWEVYFGRFLTFLTIAIVQALFVTLGDMYLLGTYVVNQGWFVLFALINSAVFMLIVYTLVSVFGNVGKAMGIVMLVLQLAGAGGTFPVQMTPAIFQAIHPYLPFTYAISLMREAVGGIVWDVVYRDLFLLALFAAAALVIGLGLKGPINRIGKGMVEKSRKSGLLH